jgi:hypothetical protein
VDVTGQESSLETSRGSVQNDTSGDQERGQSVINAGQSLDGGGTTEQKHRGPNDISKEAEEGLVGSAFPVSVDDFTHSVSRRGDLLEGNGENTEGQHTISQGPAEAPA